ncbi:prepilin-type N-terminal cleavage/methylation domain-containing protein [Clostridium sp. CS001]|uniref:prepilin-type N-terminal cleavage/methylation domain-containing protein n=1 Tax=Clostridium sp. CS001 TaxID=2880648 RepID=UPI001CF1AC26|nr:prepilin-type N-terminal cleavage/methylation domain-containing protein [Clostridium sp. CS001]MCB2289670.1 prepilin-type N-terminal cleavage/methylation domain-containing protein [Clostridium sp. CS001]
MKFIKNKKGLTLIEIIISLAILSIIIAPILSLTLNSVKINKKSDEKMEALSLAQTKIEEIRSPKYKIDKSSYTQIGNELTRNYTEGAYKITETLLIPSQSQVVGEFNIITDNQADIVVKFDGANIGVYDKDNGALIKDLGEIKESSIIEVKCDNSKLILGLDGDYQFNIASANNFEINMKIYSPNINLRMNVMNFSDNGKLKLHFIKQDESSQFTFNKFIGNIEYYSINSSDLPNNNGDTYRLYEVKVKIEKISTGEILQELKGYKKNF